MPRSEEPIRAPHGPLVDFALDLRQIRREAGSPTYRELAERTGYAASTLSKAASGRRLPSLNVLLAFVSECGGQRTAWRFRWVHLKIWLGSHTARTDEISRRQSEPGPEESGLTAAAAAIAAELSAMVDHVRQSVHVSTLAPSQLSTGRERRRCRHAGSSRHLADVISASRGPAGAVSHVRIAKALGGDPRCALDGVLVAAIVRACHELCGAPYTSADESLWTERVAAADRS